MWTNHITFAMIVKIIIIKLIKFSCNLNFYALIYAYRLVQNLVNITSKNGI